jgi:hypothetical protein
VDVVDGVVDAVVVVGDAVVVVAAVVVEAAAPLVAAALDVTASSDPSSLEHAARTRNAANPSALARRAVRVLPIPAPSPHRLSRNGDR